MFTVQTLTSVINQLLPEPQAGLLSGILFGTKATIPKDLSQALVTTGTLHIVALSGMNITILTDLVNLTLLKVVSRRIASLLTIILVFSFVWFVGASPSVVRAAIMGTISLLAVVFGRQYWALLSWILAVGIMLLLNFAWLGDLSFQLSALATLGIILFGSREMSLRIDARNSKIDIEARKLKIDNPNSTFQLQNPTSSFHRLSSFIWLFIATDLRLTLAAQVFTIPLILWQFHRLSLISPLTNVLIGWIIQPLTVMGLLTAILGYIFLPFGQLVAWATWVPLTYLVLIVQITSKIPLASLGW